MDGAKHGQRLLMALSQEDVAQARESTALYNEFLAAVVGGICLVVVVAMCVCNKGSTKEDDEDLPERQYAAIDNAAATVDMETPDGIEMRSKVLTDGAGAVNGGHTPLSSPLKNSDHKRQASTSSMPAGMRPTSLRELPEPPVSATRHNRNTSMPGIELPPVPQEPPGAADGSDGDNQASGNNTYAYPKHVVRRGSVGNVLGGAVAETEKIKVKSNTDGYDHLGQKPQAQPVDYDSLSPGSRNGEATPLSDASSGHKLTGTHHYSMVRERHYDVVKDVKKSTKVYDPYSTVSDKDIEEPIGEVYRPSKEEDPYNHIGESDGAVSNSFIRHVRHASDVTDPYSKIQDDSGGDIKQLARGAVGGIPRESTHRSPVIDDHHHDYDETEDGDEGDSAESRRKSLAEGGFDETVEEAVYAIVQKTRSNSDARLITGPAVGAQSPTEEYPYYGAAARPPEPPRMYNVYDEEEEDSYSVTSPTGEKKEHKYSKVTARESLASMSARNALNPYETVRDIPENTYATVEGGSGDGVVLRHVDSDVNVSNRNSQNSDVYAEIAISGGGMSTSIISNTSSGGAAGRASGMMTVPDPSSALNSSTNSNAPAPPSLDSLHLMTKSQTSSEGDRLSERHLATPEDSGLEAAGGGGLSPLHAWGERNFEQDEDSAGSLAEDGYSTLKKVNNSLRGMSLNMSGLPSPTRASSEFYMVKDVESGEVTQLSPGYTTVKDCVSEEDLTAEMENDPNYESVDEARAKLNQLNKSTVGSPSGKKNVTVVNVSHTVKSSTTLQQTSVTHTSISHGENRDVVGNNSFSPRSTTPRSGRKSRPYEDIESPSVPDQKNKPARRRPNHDYEELDLSLPTSPSSPPPSRVPQSLTSPLRTPVNSPSHPTPLSEARARIVRSHMYEELSEVRSNSSQLSHNNRSVATRHAPNISNSTTSPSTTSNNKDKRSTMESTALPTHKLKSPTSSTSPAPTPPSSLQTRPTSSPLSTPSTSSPCFPHQSELTAATSLNSYSASRLGNRNGVQRYSQVSSTYSPSSLNSATNNRNFSPNSTSGGSSAINNQKTNNDGASNSSTSNSANGKKPGDGIKRNSFTNPKSKPGPPATFKKRTSGDGESQNGKDGGDGQGKSPDESHYTGTRV